MNCVFSERADRDLGKLPPEVRKRIVSKLEFVCKNDIVLLNSKQLVGSLGGFYRLRVGDYRIIFDCLDSNQILILRVGHRKDIYIN